MCIYGVQWRSHWGGKGGQSATPDSEKFAKKREKIGKKRKKSGRKGKNRESSFTLPLLTDRAGYATDGVGVMQEIRNESHPK